MFGIGTNELLIFVVAALPGLAVLFFVIRAVLNAGNRNDKTPK